MATDLASIPNPLMPMAEPVGETASMARIHARADPVETVVEIEPSVRWGRMAFRSLLIAGWMVLVGSIPLFIRALGGFRTTPPAELWKPFMAFCAGGLLVAIGFLIGLACVHRRDRNRGPILVLDHRKVRACRARISIPLADVLGVQILKVERGDQGDSAQLYQVTIVFRQNDTLMRALLCVAQEINIKSVREAFAACGLPVAEHRVGGRRINRESLRLPLQGTSDDYIEPYDQPRVRPMPQKDPDVWRPPLVKPQCRKCGYSLEGLGQPPRCPECGADFVKQPTERT